MYLCPTFLKSGCGEMVDTLVSGASASRRVGSTPIIRTKKVAFRLNLTLKATFFYLNMWVAGKVIVYIS